MTKKEHKLLLAKTTAQEIANTISIYQNELKENNIYKNDHGAYIDRLRMTLNKVLIDVKNNRI